MSAESDLKQVIAEVRKLRARVTALEGGTSKAELKTIRESDTGSAGSREYAGTRGNYVPVNYCFACGRDKHGSTLIMCSDCNREVDQSRKTGVPLRYFVCGNCGHGLKGMTRPQCGKCEVDYRRQRDGT